jgi:hypothetical protein
LRSRLSSLPNAGLLHALTQFPLNLDPLDFIEGDLVASAIVELGGARALMRRHSGQRHDRNVAEGIKREQIHQVTP